MSRQEAADQLATKGTIIKGIIGQEKHEDGQPHLHVYVKYLTKIRTKVPTFFDITAGDKVYHGKYETAKSAIASIKYITKEDTEPLELGDMDYKQEVSAK